MRARGSLRADGRVVAVAAISAAVAVALTALVVAGTVVPSLDRHVLDAANAHRSSALNDVAGVVIDMFSPPVDVAVLLGAALVVSRRTGSWRPLVLALVAVVALVGVVLAMKFGVGRAAPPPHHPFDGAFPSGHTATTLVCYGTVAMLVGSRRRDLRRRLTAVTAGVTALVGAALVYGGYHWLSDVVAAVPFGTLVLAAVYLASVRIILSEPGRDPGSTHA